MGKNNKLLLSFLFLVFFWGISFFQKGFFIWFGFFIMIYSTYRTYDKKDRFERTIVYYCIFVFLSCIYSWLFNHQPLRLALAYSYHFFGVLFYFVVKRYSPSINESIKFLKIIMILTTICYLIQWIIYPTVIFNGSMSEFDITDNFFRMRFYCSFLFYLLFLYGINKYVQNHKLIYLAYSAAGLLPIIIMAFRSLIAMTFFSMVLTVIAITKRNATSYIKYIILGSILVYASLQVPMVQEKMDEMTSRKESEQTFSNDDYIRNLALAYYTTEFSENISMWVLGGGHPQIGVDDSPKNNYQRIFSEGFSLYMFWNDLGLIGLSFIIGIVSVLLLIFLCIKTMYDCKFEELQFIRFGIFCVLIATIITSMELYRNGNLVVLGLLFYIVHLKKSNLLQNSIR